MMATGVADSGKMPSILIVDDIPANLKLLSGMLRERGYEPRPLPSGKLALRAALADPPDLVLLDVNMPGMNGYEVCERFKADAALKDIPIIFITAYTETADKIKAFAMGAVDYVTKPFQVEEVAARVQTHLRIRALQREISEQNANLARLVEERTAELVSANARLLDSNRLKQDFLRMIAHEIRTPACGILLSGDLILDLCPDSEERTEYAEHFQKSVARLCNLIDDATLITDVENLALKDGALIPLSVLLDQIGTAVPDLRMAMNSEDPLTAVALRGDPNLLNRTLETLVRLAAAFSTGPVSLTGSIDARTVRMRFDLDALSLSETAIAGFFAMESVDRGASVAQSLGLAPVVAHSILTALGGEMKLIKGEGNHGFLEASFLRDLDRDKKR